MVNLWPPFEIRDQLPRSLASDLEDYRERNPDVRFVILIDEYERLFEQGGLAAAARDNAYDKIIRDFIAHASGALITIFGRERLAWSATSLGIDVLSRFICNTWDEATAGSTRQFDAVVIGAGMFGGYCADKIFRFGEASGLKVLVLDAGAFLVGTHVQNLPNAGLNVPGPITPSNDPGLARELVWGIPWRGNVDFIGQAYCIGGKSLYWGGWCPRLLASDLSAWPSTVGQYLNQNYPLLEQQTGVDVKTDFIQGPLFTLLKQRIATFIQNGSLAHIDSVEDPPLAVEGQSPASGLTMQLHLPRLRTRSLHRDDRRGDAARTADSQYCSATRCGTSPSDPFASAARRSLIQTHLDRRRWWRLRTPAPGQPRHKEVDASTPAL